MKTKSVFLGIFLALLLTSCGSSHKLTLAPIKTFDPDNRDIPPPKEIEENQIWDIMDMTFFYQIEKVLDLNWTLRKAGKLLHVAPPREADNVNALDEVPNSSWYTNRHFYHPMTLEELARGPNTSEGPDQSGPWIITRGKFEGGTPGFFIKDAKGQSYILKFDAPDYPEMSSSAEVISTKILYACGYNVPENYITYFDPGILVIGKTTKMLDKGIRRPMTRTDLENMLKNRPRRSDGKIRAMASKFVPGRPVGIWNYRGRRKDDPNDLVAHEHRRELRGLRVISSWLNDADRRAANTLAVYVEENGKRFIKHYLIDMGSTLGSNNLIPHAPKYGNEYLVDLRTIALSFIALGLYVKPWEFETGYLTPQYPSVGYFESKIFDPGRWVPTYPNPAFENCTLRDAYWGAKQVMAFTNEQIRAIVETAQMSDPEAKEYLIKTLIERRDKIGRYWFSRMNPLDKFTLVNKPDGGLVLRFHDLAVDGQLSSAEESRYHYLLTHKPSGKKKKGIVEKPLIPVSNFVDSILNSGNGIKDEKDKIFSIKIHTQRQNNKLSKAVLVYFYYPGNSSKARIVGIQREE